MIGWSTSLAVAIHPKGDTPPRKLLKRLGPRSIELKGLEPGGQDGAISAVTVAMLVYSF